MKKIIVNTQKQYPIYFQHPDVIAEINAVPGRKIIITDDTVKSLHAETLACQVGCDVLSMAPGEATKNRDTKQVLEDQMLALRLMRDTCVIALGGGVVCDMAGFVAATYCRGVPVIYIPTTLLAMVDASVGGKTGVNTEHGKNLIGTFTQPLMVFIDVHYLSTLPWAEFKNGVVETIKHALIADAAFFDFLQENAAIIQRLDDLTLCSMIYHSVNIKAQIVSEDEREQSGRRALLNCGHTYGHAIEMASDYTVSHGMAVAAGIVLEAQVAIDQGLLDERVLDVILAVFERYQIEVSEVLNQYTSDQLITFLSLDKKRVGTENYYVALDAIGSAHLRKMSCA